MLLDLMTRVTDGLIAGLVAAVVSSVVILRTTT